MESYFLTAHFFKGSWTIPTPHTAFYLLLLLSDITELHGKIGSCTLNRTVVWRWWLWAREGDKYRKAAEEPQAWREECLGKGVPLVKGSGKASHLFFNSTSTDSLKICISLSGIKLAIHWPFQVLNASSHFSCAEASPLLCLSFRE